MRSHALLFDELIKTNAGPDGRGQMAHVRMIMAAGNGHDKLQDRATARTPEPFASRKRLRGKP